MKNNILENLKNYKELSSEEIMNLNEQDFLNSTFKLNLLKDKQKGAKVSDEKFYLSNGDFVVKLQYDDVCERLVVCPSKDVGGFVEFLNVINGLGIKKIEVYVNSGFVCLQTELKKQYNVELVRKDRFLNNKAFENEVVLSKLKGEI